MRCCQLSSRRPAGLTRPTHARSRALLVCAQASRNAGTQRRDAFQAKLSSILDGARVCWLGVLWALGGFF